MSRPSPIGLGFPRGTRIGRYLVLDQLEPDDPIAPGCVAHDPELDRRVLLRLFDLGERQVTRLKAVARLSHPDLVKVHDAGTAGESVFIAMERCEGRQLDRLLAAEPSSVSRVVRLFAAGGRALSAAHAAGIAHGRFSAASVLVSRDDRARLVDLGHPGTPGGGPADASGDQRDFCRALAEALCGGRRRIPTRIRRALARGQATDPAARFRSMDDLLAELAPPPRTGRIAIAAGGVLAVIAGGLLWLAAAGEPAAPGAAAPPEDLLAGVWSDQIERSVRGAFAQSGSPLAGDAAARVAGAFDAYRDAWVEMRVAVRRASRERGGGPDDILDLQIECLDRRRDQLAALIAVLRDRPDAAMVQSAAQAARSLPALDACADPEALARPSPIPRHRAAAAAELRKEIDRLEAMVRASRGRQAADGAAAVADRARAIEVPRVEAEALHVQGTALYRAGDGAGAETALRQAMVLAARSGAGDLEAKVAIQLVQVVGVVQRRFDEALVIADLAAGEIARAGNSPRLRSALDNALGNTFQQMGRDQEAARHYREAISLRAQADGPLHVDLWKPIHNLATVTSTLGRRDEALGYSRRAVEIARSNLGPDHPDVSTALHGMATAYLQGGDAASALDPISQAVEIARRALGDDHPLVATHLTTMSEVLWRLGRYQEALDTARRSRAVWETTSGPDSLEVADLLSGEASRLTEIGRHREAVDALSRALAIRRAASGPRHPELAGDLLLMSAIRLEQGQRAQAWSEAGRAHAIASAAGDPSLVADALEAMALVRLAERRYPEAVALAERALKGGEEGEESVDQRGGRLRLVAGMNLEARRFGAARVAYDREREHWERSQPESVNLAGALIGAARAEAGRGEHAAAAELAERALATLANRPEPFLLERVQARLQLARALWSSRGDRRRALELARAARDEISDTELKHELGAGRGQGVREEIERWLAEARSR